MPKVFVSYSKENKEAVENLVDELEQLSIDVWYDKNKLLPGMRWEDAIRDGIANGDYFIACFSQEYAGRDQSYMNEELVQAIDRLRRLPTSRTWFIPIRINECKIPLRSIGGGETLHSIQHVDLFRDWKTGVRQIQSILLPDEPYIHNRYSYHYRILDSTGSRALVQIASDIEVLKETIPKGGMAWNWPVENLDIMLFSLDKNGERVDSGINLAYSGPEREGSDFIWRPLFDPPLVRGDRISIVHTFFINDFFNQERCSDSFSARRDIGSFDVTVEFPSERPAMKWQIVCDYVHGRSDRIKLYEHSKPTTKLFWKGTHLLRGSVYRFQWDW